MNKAFKINLKKLQSKNTSVAKSEFSKIYDFYKNYVFIVAYNKLNNNSASEEVLQDYFNTLWKNRHKIKNVENIKSYIATKVNFMVIDYFRKNKNTLPNINRDPSEEELQRYKESRDWRG